MKPFIALVGCKATAKSATVTSPIGYLSNAVVVQITPKIVDIFLNQENPFPTGFEASCWLRLAKRGNSWVQTHGIRLPSWQFKKLVGGLK